MSSRFANEWITDLDDEVFRWGVACQEALNELSLPSRYPEFDAGEKSSNLGNTFEVFETLDITTIMPPKIRTLSTVVFNDDHHRLNPSRVLYSSQPFLQGATDIGSCVISFESVTLLTNTSLDFT
jgi:hypothetical protein